MKGTLLQLFSSNQEDFVLTGNPTFTFFKVLFRRHTSFAIECCDRLVSGRFGSRCEIPITNVGDLVNGITIHIKTPIVMNKFYGVSVEKVRVKYFNDTYLINQSNLVPAKSRIQLYVNEYPLKYIEELIDIIDQVEGINRPLQSPLWQEIFKSIEILLNQTTHTQAELYNNNIIMQFAEFQFIDNDRDKYSLLNDTISNAVQIGYPQNEIDNIFNIISRNIQDFDYDEIYDMIKSKFPLAEGHIEDRILENKTEVLNALMVMLGEEQFVYDQQYIGELLMLFTQAGILLDIKQYISTYTVINKKHDQIKQELSTIIADSENIIKQFLPRNARHIVESVINMMLMVIEDIIYTDNTTHIIQMMIEQGVPDEYLLSPFTENKFDVSILNFNNLWRNNINEITEVDIRGVCHECIKWKECDIPDDAIFNPPNDIIVCPIASSCFDRFRKKTYTDNNEINIPKITRDVIKWNLTGEQNIYTQKYPFKGDKNVYLYDNQTIDVNYSNVIAKRSQLDLIFLEQMYYEDTYVRIGNCIKLFLKKNPYRTLTLQSWFDHINNIINKISCSSFESIIMKTFFVFNIDQVVELVPRAQIHLQELVDKLLFEEKLVFRDLIYFDSWILYIYTNRQALLNMHIALVKHVQNNLDFPLCGDSESTLTHVEQHYMNIKMNFLTENFTWETFQATQDIIPPSVPTRFLAVINDIGYRWGMYNEVLNFKDLSLLENASIIAFYNHNFKNKIHDVSSLFGKSIICNSFILYETNAPIYKMFKIPFQSYVWESSYIHLQDDFTYMKGDLTLNASLMQIEDLLEKVFNFIHCKASIVKVKQNMPTHNDHIYWQSLLGYRIIERMSLYIGDKEIDVLDGRYLWLYLESQYKNSQQRGIQQMLQYDEIDATKQHNIYIPLLFECFRNCLPIIALTNTIVKIVLQMSELETCIINPHPNITCGNMKIRSLIDYIYLDLEERKKFINSKHEIIVKRVQMTKQYTFQDSRFNMNGFSDCIVDVFWLVEEKGNPWKFIPMDNTQLWGQSQPLCASESSIYYTCLVPTAKYQRTPSMPVHMYSFALYPLDLQPSGCLNYSRLDTKYLQLGDNVDTSNIVIYMYVRSFNILRVMSGQAGYAFQ
uniref:Major capsid protein n=1 Tax=Megaviridae environmental sample TaxID=1737588 RepID=A0A5J6VJK6_9VIRU|nr:MAG: major capsid protein [Megaviridae environmental sample]